MNNPAFNQNQNNDNSTTKRPLLSLKKSDKSAKIDLINKANAMLSIDGNDFPTSMQGIICLIPIALKRAVSSINRETGFQLSDDVVISPLDCDASDDDIHQYSGLHKKTLREYLDFYTEYHHCYDTEGNPIDDIKLQQLYGKEVTTLSKAKRGKNKLLTIIRGFVSAKPHARTDYNLRQIIKNKTDYGIKILPKWDGQEIPNQDEDTHLFLNGIYYELLEWFVHEKELSGVLSAEDTDRLIAIASESKNEYHSLAAQLMISLGKSN